MAMTQLQCPFCQNAFSADLSSKVEVLTCPHCRQEMQAPTDPEPTLHLRYFYSQNRQRLGPCSFGELQQLAMSGRLQPTDMVLPENSNQWIAAQSLPGLFPSMGGIQPPPSPYVPPPYDDKSEFDELAYGDGALSENFISSWGKWAWLHIQRTVMWDLRHVPVQDDEKASLAEQGVEDDTLQRYFAWRRSTLVVLCFPVLMFALLNTIDQLLNLKFNELTTFGVVWQVLHILAPFAMALAAVLAALLWSMHKLSFRIIVVGWGISFGLPIALYMAPVNWVWIIPADFTGIPVRVVRGVYFFAMMSVLSVVFLVSISLGAQRACLRLKTLIPQSPIPGLFLIVSAPVLPMLLLPVFVFFTQTAASLYLIAAVTLIVASCMIYALWGHAFFRPLSSAREFGVVRRVQWLSKTLFWCGVACVFMYALNREITAPAGSSLQEWTTKTLLGFTKANSYIQPWTWWFLRVVFFELPGRAMFTVVLVADVLIRMTVSVWYNQEQVSASARGTDVRTEMETMQRTLNQN